MRWKRSKPKSSARSYALWLLGRQAYAAQRLRERLVRRGYSVEEANDAVDYLIEIKYLDDEVYATSFVAGQGPRKLRWELKARGVDAALIDQAIAKVPEQTLFEQAERLARRRLRGKELADPRVISSLCRYLLQRGYDYALVEDVVRKVRDCLDREGQSS